MLTFPQAVSVANGRITYQQLWRAARAGRVEVFQPNGPTGHYRIARAELERFLQPVKRRR